MRKILSIILLFAALLFTPQGAFAKGKSVKFVQVTDTHYVLENEAAEAWIKQLVKEINRTEGVDFVVFTGDNIDSPDAKSLHSFLRLVGRIRKPCYFVVGNHEVSRNARLDKSKYYDIVRAHNWFSPAWKANYTFKKKGFLFVVMDGAKEIIPGPNGYYRQETLDWLDKVLAKNKDRRVVILQHFPLVEPRKMNSHRTYKAENYLELLDKHENVVAVISGHYHTNSEEMRNGVYHVSSPAFSDEPHYYKVIEIMDDKDLLPMVFTQLREFGL